MNSSYWLLLFVPGLMLFGIPTGLLGFSSARKAQALRRSYDPTIPSSRFWPWLVGAACFAIGPGVILAFTYAVVWVLTP